MAQATLSPGNYIMPYLGTSALRPDALPGTGLYFPSVAVYEGAVVARYVSGTRTASGF